MALIPILAAVAVIFLLLYCYVIDPVFVSPLSKIPNAHPSASISSLWIMHKRLFFRENRAIYAAHQKFGPVVRLGPNEVSVNCVDNGLRTIYPGGYEKGTWYDLFSNFDGVPTMFSMAESKPHAQRKRMMSNIYAKSTIQSSRGYAIATQHIVDTRLLPLMLQHITDKEAQGAVDLYQLLNYTTMDMVTAYMFGLHSSSNFLQDQDEANRWLGLYQSRKKFTFWPQELPGLTSFMQNFGIHLSPKWVADANRELEAWCLRMCDTAGQYIVSAVEGDDELKPENTPNVYRQLRNTLQTFDEIAGTKQDSSSSLPQATRLSIASEMLDQLSAGHETSAISLTYLFYELCLHPDIQDSLRDELHTALPDLKRDLSVPAGQQPSFPSTKAIDSLPLLHAIIMETMRLHPAIPGPQPRITPTVPTSDGSNGVTLGTYTSIPAGVRVSSSPYSLHRNESVFPSPLSFKPERWLPPIQPPTSVTTPASPFRTTEAQQREQNRWFWAFSSGGRMCIGSNLAMQQMKLITAALVANFRFADVLDEGPRGGMLQEDTYTAHPSGGKLVVRIHAFETIST